MSLDGWPSRPSRLLVQASALPESGPSSGSVALPRRPTVSPWSKLLPSAGAEIEAVGAAFCARMVIEMVAPPESPAESVATSADGKLQVELAQQRYRLPRLVGSSESLSRLAGGIGGRGPGETPTGRRSCCHRTGSERR